MEKLIYCRNDLPPTKLICADKDFYEELKTLLAGYIRKRLLKVEVSPRFDNVWIMAPGQYVDWYKVYLLLKENGYVFSEKLQERFEKLEQKFKKESQRKAEREEELRKIREQAPKRVLWCNKYGCPTKDGWATCLKCWRHKDFGCKPEEVFIEN